MKIIYFYGEIFNRAEFGVNGSDADICVCLLRKYGLDAIKKLRGAFAFAIDTDTEVILVRDQFGTVPFYYAESNTGIKYDINVRGLLQKGIPARLSRKGFCVYMAYGYLQSPWTMIDGVFAVPAASYVKYNKRSSAKTIVEYWRPSFEVREWSRDDFQESIRLALLNSVKQQTSYGGSPAVFLSGGLDSSAIAVMMRQAFPDDEIRTYCVTHENPRYDERKWAHMVAENCHAKHTDLLLTESFISDSLQVAADCYDQPSMDGMNFWFGFKMVKEYGESVILSGEGGDELFLSEIYKALLACRAGEVLRFFPRFIGLLLEKFAYNEKMRKFAQLFGCSRSPYFLAYSVFSEMRIASLVKSELVDFDAVRHPVEAIDRGAVDIYNYVSWMDLRNADIDMYQRDGFQTGAAHGIRLRMPILDVDLVEQIYSIRGDAKYDATAPKPFLSGACGELLPVEIATRSKKGFSLPFKEYLKGDLRSGMEAFLLGGESLLFNAKQLCELGRRFYEGKVYWSNVWLPFMAENWCRVNNVKP